MTESATRIDGLTKHYGSVKAIGDISLQIDSGTVHALLGPNGAGKSTLIKCISGAVKPTAGTITIAGQTFAGLTPRQAMEAGVSVVHQHFSLVGHLSVADNVFLGNELRGFGGVVRRREQEERTDAVLRRLRAPLDARQKVAGLSVAQQQVVEIAKAINRDAKLLILDEPTASLSSAEREGLLDLVRTLRDEGLQILYITHLLDEVRALADSVTVLRDGAVSLSGDAAALSTDDLIRAISGNVTVAPVQARDLAGAGEALEVAGLAGDRIGPIDLRVRRGEVLGVFGLLGAGRTELLESIYGIRRRTAGTVRVQGDDVATRLPGRAIASGMALVPAERIRQSLFGVLGVGENLLVSALSRLSRFGWLRRPKAERGAYERTAAELQVRAAGPTLPVLQLSGGNQQKVAIGRWLVDKERIKVLLLDEPTQGIDVGTRTELYRLIREMSQEQGVGVVVTSSYPEEIQAFADRAIVLRHGKVVAELAAPDIDDAALLRYANGILHD